MRMERVWSLESLFMDLELEAFIRFRVEVLKYSYKKVSDELANVYGERGFSERNVRRFCKKFVIKKTYHMDDDQLDRVVSSSILKVCRHI